MITKHPHKTGVGQKVEAPKEHQINGTRLTANITGTFNFDWNAYSQFVLTPLGATLLGNDNLPTGTNSKEIKGIIKAGAAVTKPANWNATADSDAFDNTLDNHFRAWVSAEGVVTFTNKNKAASGGTGTENIAAGAFTGVLDVSGGNRYYDDYTSGPPLDLSLSTTKVLGSQTRVRIKGGLINSMPTAWNFSGQEVSANANKLNELTLLFVNPNDVNIVNRVFDVPDNEAPTIPINLSASNTDDSSTTLNWTASTDNIGVTEYKVYKGGVLESTVNTNTAIITGLIPETANSFTVSALDAAGNESAQSTALAVNTTAAGSTPLDLTNLNLWFDGGDSSSMTLNGSNGISAFTDKTGIFTVQNQPSGDFPLFANNQIEFDTSSILQNTANVSAVLAPGVDYHGFFIFKNTNTNARDFFNNSNSTSSRFAIGYKSGAVTVGTYNGSSFNAKSIALADLTNYHVLEFKQVSGVITALLDGVNMTGTATPTTIEVKKISLNGPGTTSIKGYHFKEIFVKAGEMTTAERDAMLTYINTKHGL